jgi:hypothetical protein
MKRAKFALLALVLASAAPAPAQSPPPDVPPGPARIEGVVRRAETGQPVAGVEVALYALTAEGVPGLRRTTSDAAGGFVFDRVANDPAIGWLVGARFEGVAFPGGRVVFAPGESVARIEVRVDRPTPDPSAVRVAEHSLRLVRQPGGLRAIETVALHNDGQHTYYVPAEGRAMLRPALTSTVPAQATSFEMPLGVVPEGLVRSGGTLRWFGPVLPGAQELSWSYVLPPESPASEGAPERYAFALTVPAKTERLALLLADPDATLEGAGLAEPEAVEEDGRRVRRWTLAAPRAGALPLRVSLPPARVAAGDVSLAEVRAVLTLDDAALDVTETHVLSVAGDTHVLGTNASPLLRIPVPEGASKLRFGSDAPGLELGSDPAGGFAVLGAVAPGEARIEIAYQLPVGEPPARFSRTLGARTPVLSVFVADTGRLAPRTERLHRRRPLRTDDLTYLHFEAFEVAAGEPVTLEIGTLPARGRSGERVALGFVIAAALGAAWLMTSPLREARSRSASEPAEEGELSAARREREALYEAIRDLDHDFETGKVTAEDHARLRDELRARAAALLAEERKAGSSGRAASAASGETSCSACGATADPSHRFCPQCGAALAPQGAA